MTISKLRKQIDALDKKILELLNQRANITLSIGHVKAKNKSSVYVPNREKEIYEHIASANKGPLSNDALKACLLYTSPSPRD